MTTLEDDGTRLRSGEPVADLAPVIEAFGPEAVLVNCTAPEVIADALRVLKPVGIPTGAYGNGFVKIVEDYKTSTATVGQLSARPE